MQAEVEAKDAEIDRQQKELQTLRVRNLLYSNHALIIRRNVPTQQQAQQKDAEIQRQQSELRVRTYWYNVSL